MFGWIGFAVKLLSLDVVIVTDKFSQKLAKTFTLFFERPQSFTCWWTFQHPYSSRSSVGYTFFSSKEGHFSSQLTLVMGIVQLFPLACLPESSSWQKRVVFKFIEDFGNFQVDVSFGTLNSKIVHIFQWCLRKGWEPANAPHNYKEFRGDPSLFFKILYICLW